jgi:hypothetical protein
MAEADLAWFSSIKRLQTATHSSQMKAGGEPGGAAIKIAASD